MFFVPVMIPLLQQGMLCRCKSRVLLPGAICFPAAIGLCTFGAPSLAMRFPHHWSLPLVQADSALPVGFHVAGDSHLVWRQWLVLLSIPKQRNFRCVPGKRVMLTNGIARTEGTAPSFRPALNSSFPDVCKAAWTLIT